MPYSLPSASTSMSRNVILRILGVLWAGFATILIIYASTSFFFHDIGFAALSKRIFVASSILTIGVIFIISTRNSSIEELSPRSAVLLVILVWMSMVFLGTIPYYWEDIAFIDALFEAASGFSTTGSTIFSNVEILPQPLLLWRSLTQWIGGMGIIVLFIAIFPSLGMAGKRLFSNEMPGPIKETLTPHLKDTTRYLWQIYLFITLILFFCLLLAGLSPFDAINHALTTTSTGGFSTKNASLAAFSANVQWIITLFMFIGGVNFSLYIYLIKWQHKAIYFNTEVRWYFVFIMSLSIITATLLYFTTEHSLGVSGRLAFFTVVSLTTTTGYSNYNYETWTPLLQALLFITFFTGGSAGSTSGGIKFYRIVLFSRALYIEIKKSISPHLVSNLSIGNFNVPQHVTHKIFLFISVYFVSVGIVALILVAGGIDFLTAFSAAATSIGNVGPGFGMIGPNESFAAMPALAKLVCAWAMILGRLEFFTFLAILQPAFWKR